MNFSGEIELERVATKSKPFGYAELVLGNKVSIDAYFFDVVEFTYYVTVAGAMGSGISLEVYRGDKQVVDLFSGNVSTNVSLVISKVKVADHLIVDGRNLLMPNRLREFGDLSPDISHQNMNRLFALTCFVNKHPCK